MVQKGRENVEAVERNGHPKMYRSSENTGEVQNLFYSEKAVSSAYYVEVLMRLCEAVCRERPGLWPNNWFLRHDNAPTHQVLSNSLG
jgi:hypothetical protein